MCGDLLDCTLTASFVKECSDVSYVAGEGVELTVQKETVVVQERKEVELRSRYAQFINWAAFGEPTLRKEFISFLGAGVEGGWYFWEVVADLLGNRCLLVVGVFRSTLFLCFCVARIAAVARRDDKRGI